ncbi:molybdopterin-guanine dinucleotide biosynthesis protein MobA [Limosilactobacillus reuteri]|uniref:Molybdopterin-guanine dinucleotide biosynthesis protein MobA n=1 Tax=Limosilactobacillus reuteri TaxID=1598 RepID=A0A1Y3UNY1_LIMRT|nr:MULTISPECIES: NTP transferase domain-containing protein [Limosilactobacillus]MQB61791.1 molybdopterin-guanine dinucleotide biosynthesis protein MobA [Limosilactobacillus reuteri]MQB89342.1 molybdopterin-guanine dinucleotide biosynthesis protein MobA [Limosilactobacillus reuteri]OUN48878.1 molybdopterin-guanine dinucleotide biosynthesis protein MobA [Limosilactobacillus reuteri]OUP89008.1 molybdopterin-guanine dinucleotide biosynthesis protein MobA [Limosilactobacillus reuteri]
MIGLVYAGGKSTRFGKDKATYHVPGLPATNIELAVEKLTPFCQQIVVCANEINRAHILKLVGQEPAVQIICDISPYDHHGPLSAIIACTSQFSVVQDYLTLAVDYPYITKDVLAILARTSNSYIVTSQHSHYSLAHFSVSNEQVTTWVDNNSDWRLRSFITNKCGCHPLAYRSSAEFSNLNYREVDLNEK